MFKGLHFEDWLYKIATLLSETENTEGREGSELGAGGQAANPQRRGQRWDKKAKAE